MCDPEKLREMFRGTFGREARIVTFAPGRVNLIGEHTDYNGGHVFPCAISQGTLCAAAPRDDGAVRLASVNIRGGKVSEKRLSDARLPARRGWESYPLGVVWALSQAGFRAVRGMDIMLWGDVPAGAGLSSSASLEVAFALALNGLFGFGLSLADIALLSQKAENGFVGMNCGIMDQFASAMGREDRAIFLDTASLEYEYAPLELGGAEIIIVNSGVRHSLASSEYNRRREECAEALRQLCTVKDIAALCLLSPEEFEDIKRVITDPVCLKRARHAVYENARTVAALAALRAGDTGTFGRLMNESHVSLRDDYEVSCPELDLLTSLAWAAPGVIGARMTGGGFGGCMVSIVESGAAEELIKTLGGRYESETGLKAAFYTARPGPGAHII